MLDIHRNRTALALALVLAGCGDNESARQDTALGVAASSVESTTSPLGWLDHVEPTRSVAEGWAFTPDRPSGPVLVAFYVDGPYGEGTYAGSAATNVYRADVNQAYGVSGNHGFSWTIPAQWHDGTHSLYAYTIDAQGSPTVLLGNAPLRFSRAPQGTLDTVDTDRSVAEGWTCDPELPSTSIPVHFYADRPYGEGGLFIGSTLADVSRADLTDVCGGTGAHGFSWPIPEAWRKGKHRLYAYAINPRQGPNPMLNASPKSFSYPYAVPAPRVVDDPHYHDGFSHTLATFYMPKPSWQGQWADTKLNNEKDEFKEAGGQRMPLLGYYRGDDPEVLDWHIKWAVDRGILAFVFDDYWTDNWPEPIYPTGINAFLAAQHRLNMQFAVMLENNTTPSNDQATKTARFLDVILPYYIDHYFSQPNYLVVEGKPLVHIDYPDVVLGTGDPTQLKEILLHDADALVAARTPYPGAYWVVGKAMSGDLNFSMAKSAGFSAVWPYYVLPHTWPQPDFPILVPNDSAPNQSWLDGQPPPGVDPATFRYQRGVPYSEVRTGSAKLHSDSLDAAHRDQMKFVPSLMPDADSRRLFWEKRQLYFTGQNSADYWGLLSDVRNNQLGSHSSELPVVTRTGKGLVGVGAWNEQTESSSIEPGYSAFQLENGDPFFVATAIAKLFGGPADGYDTTMPTSSYERAVPSITSWAGSALTAWEALGNAGTRLRSDGLLEVTAGGHLGAVLFTATSMPVAGHAKLEVQLSVSSGSLDEVGLHWRGSDYSDTAHLFGAPKEPGHRAHQGLIGTVPYVEKVPGVRVYTFDLDQLGDTPWTIKYLELRLTPPEGSGVVVLIKQIAFL